MTTARYLRHCTVTVRHCTVTVRHCTVTVHVLRVVSRPRLRESSRWRELRAIEWLLTSASSLTSNGTTARTFYNFSFLTSVLEHIQNPTYVLDLGFNGIRILPDDGFRNNQYLALLALDGNPLATVPEAAFAHLNSTLRGLSLGGSYLECDCKLRWILEWMKRYELQVTSRERNPQFCSQPEHLRRRTFAQLSVSDLTCQDSTPIPTGPTKGPKRLDEPEIPPPQKVPDVSPPTRVISTTSSSPGTTMKMFEEIRMLDAKVQDSSIAVQWEADSSNLLGFLVIYRRFGEPEFRHGPGIDKNHRRFILENLPPNECIVVCVVTLEDSSNLSAGAVPYGQCREVRTPGSRVDTLVIAASAAVCVVVVIAILAVLCCMRSRKSSPAVPPPPPLKAEPAEWETSSVYSTRSIPRAKMYHHDGSFLVDDNRSHISHYSQAPNGYRSTADGQSHRSYSQFSNRFTLGHPEIRKSQQSLSQVSGHHSFMSAPRPGHAAAKNGRLTSASSLHSLSEYNDWHRKGYGGPSTCDNHGHRKRRQFKQTDAFTRGMVIGLKRAGWSIRQIAADTHLGASTVHRLWRRWLEQGNVAIYRNVGATRVTSARVDRRILRQAVAAPQATCTAILQHVQDTLDHSISTRTISRRLVANGLHSCRPLRRLPLTPPNRRQRLEWCRARSTWMTEWHRVVFSDESRFCLSSDSRRVRVWRRRGERSNPAAIVERPTVRQRGIMVWGAIAYDSRSPLLRIQGTMTAQRYVDDVLRPVTLPYLQGVPNALYQQDNARPHTARISQQALQDVQMLPWPPYSPDLSPIEHVWDIIGRRLHALPQPRSEDELWQMVEREWRAIPQDAIRTLIDSLPRRVAACIAVRGGPTCY
ncbi:hypothetical protein LAZ67_22001226 [Cordylochernes scorpioides]|uniref:Uncharacterized protein n=1 Tax=Cordylochernes scorpioides TaxID=51811 RepID=A0ABY6LPU8_9ARAC|nr:hypothetical protein LAZ67_22001226 [Cordylochernes scorpioides]